MGGCTYDGVDGLWHSMDLLPKFGARILALCVLFCSGQGFAEFQDPGLTFGGVGGFCLAFRKLARSLPFRSLAWPLMGWKASIRGVGHGICQ